MPKGHHVGPCLGPEASQRFAQHIAAHPISNDSNVNPWCFCYPSVQDVQVEHSEKFITFRDDPEGSQNSKLHQERGWLDVGHPHLGTKTWRWIHLYPLISLFKKKNQTLKQTWDVVPTVYLVFKGFKARLPTHHGPSLFKGIEATRFYTLSRLS